MKEYLSDLVHHTFDTGCVSLVKITGDDKSTVINGIEENKTVVLEGEFKSPLAEFIGTFGMPNLNKLKMILNMSEYNEDGQFSIVRDTDGNPEGILFENAAKDFSNRYRYMDSAVVNEQIKKLKMRPLQWAVTFNPTNNSIQRLKMQISVHSEEPTFQMRQKGSDIICNFGDHSSHAGSFVFERGVSGQLKHAWNFPSASTLAILNLVGDKTIRISDDGALQISLDSGLANYTYTILAHTK